MESETRVQILNKAACVSLHTDDIVKGMNPSLLSLAMGK